MLERVISGFQDGADIGGIRAAHAAGLAVGGWMPHGFRTESGPRPQYVALYGAREHPASDYPSRTRANVADADATILFSHGLDLSTGSALTYETCERLGTPIRVVTLGAAWTHSPQNIADWIFAHDFKVINVAGSRESRAPGIGEEVERFMTEVFRFIRGETT